MVAELGARLVGAGLVTSRTLAEAMGEGPLHQGDLVRALAIRGVSEDALAGYFLSLGFGPILSAADLAAAEKGALASLPAAMAHALLVLPVRESPIGLVVAMAAPSDAHALHEVNRKVRAKVVPTVARVGDLSRAVRATYPDDGASRATGPPPGAEPRTGTWPRTRPSLPSASAELFRGSTRGPERAASRATLGPMTVGDVREAVVPLVRPRPLARPRPITQRFERSDIEAWARGAPDPGATANANAVGVPAPGPARAWSAPSAAAAAPSTAGAVDPDPEGWADIEVTPVNKVRPRHRSYLRRARPRRPPPVGGILASIRASRSRDEVIDLACQGILTVAGSVVFLTVRGNALQGFHGAGRHLSREAVRNLWIPVHSSSHFRRCIERRRAYRGPHGTEPADDLFRAAIGSRGDQLGVAPVVVGRKLVALFAADDLRYGQGGLDRMEGLARGLGKAFERLIMEER
ncbi:MAG: hypothetical protein ACFCGT_07805 [Sandaracinaceae bacterium]